MTVPQHVFDGTRENFQQLVIDNSHRGLVLVNYWAPGAGPCLRLWQELEALSRDYGGRFLLINVNTESQKALARENGITSVPTVKVYRKGGVVESIYGAQSASALRQVIDRHVQPARDSLLARAIAEYQAGRVDEALALLAEASCEAPDDVKPVATALKILLREKRYDDLQRCVAALPARMQAEAEVSALQVHASLLQLAAEGPDEQELERRLQQQADDLDAMLRRAALALTRDDFEAALAGLLRVVQADREYAGQLPRKAMLVIFGLLGENHELSRAYQNRLRNTLH